MTAAHSRRFARDGAFFVLAATLCACGSGSNAPVGPLDPGPGNEVDIAFNNTSDNGTLEGAAPLGTSTTDDVTVWIGTNTIGGDKPGNYWVFQSGPGAGTFAFDGCFGSPITSMTATLWRVVKQAVVDPPVGTWDTVNGSGEGCFNNINALLAANTVYAFGLTAEGGSGTYSL